MSNKHEYEIDWRATLLGQKWYWYVAVVVSIGTIVTQFIIIGFWGGVGQIIVTLIGAGVGWLLR